MSIIESIGSISVFKRVNTFLAIMFVSSLLFGHLSGTDFIDLEEVFAQDFVLQSKKIEIPGYPEAFNPAIIRWKDSLLMSYRVVPNPRFSFVSKIGLVWLDNQFNPVGSPQMLSLRSSFSIIPSRAEDARLLTVGERLYIVYSDNTELTISKGGFRVYVAELIWNGSKFEMNKPECLSRFEDETRAKREKNWVPFDYNGELLLAYSLTPHRILKPILGTGECSTVCSTNLDIRWNWGELRGGTPGLLEGNEYLSFFHSSIDMPSLHSDGKKIAHYFMGAYTFSAEPPFRITKISPEPIVGKNFYKGTIYKPYWKPVRVVFPCGYIFDGDYIWVAYGRQDREVWVVQLDKARLLNSLIPVNISNNLENK